MSEFVAATDNMGDEEKKRMEAYNCHEALLGGMWTCTKDTTSSEKVVVEEKLGAVGGSTDYKETYSSKHTTLEKLDMEPEEEEIPVCWTKGGREPLRRQHPEVFQSQTDEFLSLAFRGKFFHKLDQFWPN